MRDADGRALMIHLAPSPYPITFLQEIDVY